MSVLKILNISIDHVLDLGKNRVEILNKKPNFLKVDDPSSTPAPDVNQAEASASVSADASASCIAGVRASSSAL